MPPDRSLRASDADRERVAAELGDHLTAGRLDTAEFEERLSSAYAARTLGELDTLLTDLPAERERPGSSAPVSLEKPEAAENLPAVGPGRSQAARFGSWLTVGLIVTGIWGISALASGEVHGFWPAWVIGPWGLALLMGWRHRGNGPHGRGPRRPGKGKD